MRWLQEGRCDAVVAGASDAQGPWLARELRDAGWSSGRAGEGAIAMLLERAEQAQRAGRRPLLHLSAARSWFDPSLQGDAWTPPGTLSPLAGSLGDCFAVEGLLQLALAGEGSPESVSVQGSCGHGASVTITTGGI